MRTKAVLSSACETVALLFLAGAVGCVNKGFPAEPVPVPTPAPVPPTALSGNGYVVDYGGALNSYTISQSGLWTQIPNTTLTVGIAPMALQVDPSGRFAYVINTLSATSSGFDSSISAFVVDPVNGALHPNTASVSMNGTYNPEALVIEPTGRFLYTEDSVAGGIAAFRIDQTSGLLTANSPATYPLVQIPNTQLSSVASLVLDPAGRFLYANTGSYLLSYTVDAGSGQLTLTGDIRLNGGGRGFPPVIDPQGRFLYVLDEFGDTVTDLAIDPATGVLTLPAGSPVAKVGDGPSSVAIDPTGRYLYVENRTAGTLSQFSVNTDGSVTPLSPATIVQGGYELLADPGGQLLYVGSDPLVILRISANGTLEPYSFAQTGQQALAFAVRNR